MRSARAAQCLWAFEARRRASRTRGASGSDRRADLSWVYSSFGANFLKSILRQSEKQMPLQVVDDQWGCPTSAHDTRRRITQHNLQTSARPSQKSSGLYHPSGAGETTWYRFAAAILAKLKKSGVRVRLLKPITTRDYKPQRQDPRTVPSIVQKQKKHSESRCPTGLSRSRHA